MKSTVSIVITSYSPHRLSGICSLLDSIASQTRLPGEVVFVADHSEELYRSVRSHVQSLPMKSEVLLHNTGKTGVNVCRNAGINASKGEIIGLLDDDVVLFSDWVEETIRVYSSDVNVAAVTGPAWPLWDDSLRMSWFPQELYFVWGCTVWDWLEERPIRNVGGMNCSFRRSALLRSGLYREDIGPVGGEERVPWFYPSGEEVELSLRLKRALGPSGRIVYSPNVRILHRVQTERFNSAFVFKRCFRFGYTRHFIKRYSDMHKIHLDQPVLQLELEHLRTIYVRLSDYIRDLPLNPLSALRTLMTLVAGVVATGLGFVAYALKPYESGSRLNGE